MDQALVASLAVSLAVGLLIGLERQRAITALDAVAESRGDKALLGGVRTFPIIALTGSISALIGPAWLPATGVLALVVLMASYRLSVAEPDREPGLTTETAALFTFLMGALCVSTTTIDDLGHRLTTCAALAVVVTLLLSVKPRLHEVVKRIKNEDIFATLQLLLVAVVLLPLLPDTAYGPFNAINPQTIGRMIVFVGGVSFVGYIANRLLGPGRGLTVAGLVGGLVSSTAVAFSMARRAKAEPRIEPAAAIAVVVASAMMFARVEVVLALLYRPLALQLALPMTAMALTGGVALFAMWRRGHHEEAATGEVELKNPFELRGAVVFGLIFGAVTFVARALRATVGDAILPLAGVVAGTTDIDAITLSVAGLARDGLPLGVAGATILAGCFSNTAVKAGIAFVVGGVSFGKRVGLVLLVMAVAGGIALGVQSAFMRP